MITSHQSNQHQHPATNLEKEFFFFSAPEEKFDQSEALRKLTSSVKRQQQVIFIKNPENNAYEKAVENLVQNAVQQKTHIYVLNKEPDYAGLQHKFQSVQQNIQHKPEVKFINYHSPSNAHHIQSSIVQQYGGGNVQPLGSSSKVVHTRSVVGDSSPVHKNYANNFLPSGVDVVPGSSYIPLI